MGHADNNIGNQNKHNILIYMLKVFSMFMVMFDYEKYDASTKLIGVTINYDNCNRYVYLSFFLSLGLASEVPKLTNYGMV